MKTRLPSPALDTASPDARDRAARPGLPDFPSADELAALRAWYAGLPSREAVRRFLPNEATKSARGAIGRIRRQLLNRAQQLKRADLANVLRHPVAAREQHAQAVAQAIEGLRHARAPVPDIVDPVTLVRASRGARAARLWHRHAR